MSYPSDGSGGPNGGALVGAGTKQWIADAAIKADMEHRGFEAVGGGRFVQTLVSGNDRTATAYRVTVSDGKVELTVTYGGSGTNPAPDLEDYRTLQGEVFEYWPGAIDDVFAGWEDMSSGAGLAGDAYVVGNGASEIAVQAGNEKGSVFAENVRLGSDLTNLKEKTGLLKGTYAETFSDSYVSGLPGTLDNLNSLTHVLVFALAAQAGIFDKTREQIAEVAVQAENAMAASGPHSDGSTTGLRIALLVVGAAAAGIATFATAGSAAAVGAALAGASAGAINGAIGVLTRPPAQPDPLPLGAGTPQGVLANLKKALADINTAIVTEENHVDDLLVAAQQESAAPTNNRFDISRPDIIGHHGQSVLESRQILLVDDELIAKITELWIPTINGDVTACATGLVGTQGSWQRPASIGLAPDGAWPHYEALQTSVRGHLLNLRSELSGAADSLQAAAVLIGRSDQNVNQRFAQKARHINDYDVDTL